MQVRPGGQASHAYVADDLPLGDVRARSNTPCEAAHVSIQCLVLAPVLDNDGVAVTALAAGGNNPAVACRFDGRAGGSSIIDAFVGANAIEHRVQAAGIEAGADSGKVNRGPDESLAHAGAVSPVVARIAIAIRVAHRGVGLAAVGKAGGQNVSRAYGFVIDVLFLKQYFEAIALADVACEVDVIAEDVGHLHCQVVIESGVLSGKKQRAVDGGLNVAFADFRLDNLLAELVAVCRSINADGFQVVQFGAHRGQLTFRVGLILQHLAYIQASEAACVLTAVDDSMQGADTQVCLIKQGGQGVAVGNGNLLPGRADLCSCSVNRNKGLVVRCGGCLPCDIHRLGDCDCFADQCVQLFRRLGKRLVGIGFGGRQLELD